MHRTKICQNISKLDQMNVKKKSKQQLKQYCSHHEREAFTSLSTKGFTDEYFPILHGLSELQHSVT